MAGIEFTPNDAGMRALANSVGVGQAMVAAAQRVAPSVPGARVRRAKVNVLGRWGGQRAGAVMESTEAAVRDLARAADRIERGGI
ncbi:hypothetical protein [Georgenia wangjunii]|uniref:hypothetical protein n=1 Tax=Georgenia wangjunii TaxID=3117730 RepID=UPI002F265AC6